MVETTGTDKVHQPVIKVTELASICVVVRDLHKSLQSFWNDFGIGPWDIYDRSYAAKKDTELIRDITYRGKPGRFSYAVAVTRGKPAGMGIELMQPVQGDSIYNDFLKEHGEGVQHVGWYNVESIEEFERVKRAMERGGYPCIQSHRSINTADAYFDTEKSLGFVLQTLWRDPSRPEVPPSRVYPR